MQFDAIVVGSGISGGWVAKELCERGLKVLMLERGPNVEHGADYSHETALKTRRRDDQIPQEERDLHYPYYVGVSYAMFNSNKNFWASDHDYPYETVEGKPYRWIRGYQLGGRSLTWGRQSYRWSPGDFESNLKDGHGVDWPIRYEDLAEWYDHVEAFAGISGSYEELPQLPDGDFLPPFPFNEVEEDAKARIEAAFPTRNLIMGRTANLSRIAKAQMDMGRKRCEQYVKCHHGCPLGSYFSSQAATLPAARATGNLTVITDTIVESVTYDPVRKRATGVRAVNRETKQGVTYEARLVFLNASAINTAALLLNSKSDAFPRGMANGSDQVGRNLMDHVSSKSVLGVYHGFDNVPFTPGRPTGLYMPRYANVTETDKPYLRGFGFQGGAAKRRWPGTDPDDRKVWVMSLLPFGEVLPNPENRVTLTPTRRDNWGIPLPVIGCEHGPNEKAMMLDAARDAAAMLEAAGCTEITPWEEAGSYLTPPGDRIHEMGTARMGRDPTTSVFNGWGQAHEVANLFASDGAVMASSASMNPSLTYMALSARAANHAADLLEQGAL
jgi:choline dehydrogenase-like flavoprotein